jgi:hypothetical protein
MLGAFLGWFGSVAVAAPQASPQSVPAEQAEETEEPANEPAALPKSRHEHLRRQRVEKSKQPEPYVPNKVERNLIRFDKAETPTIQEANFHGFYPRVAWIARGSGISFGTRYWQRDIKGSHLDLAGAAYYSIHGYQHYGVQFGLIPHRGRQLPSRSWGGEELYQLADPRRTGMPRFTLYGTLRYRYLPQTEYFGQGPDSELENHSNYLLESTSTYLRVGYQFTDHFALTLNTGYWKYSVGPGRRSSIPTTEEVFNDLTAPGLSNPPSYFRYGVNGVLDYRDEPGNPHKGFVIGANLGRSDDRTEDAFTYNTFWFDARGFIPLGTRQRVLALRSAIAIQEADAGNRIPFFVQPSLGGSHTLRGFDSFRFQGPKAMLYQLEYRWEASQIWELALFTDTGTVSQPGGDLEFSTLKWDYGFGLRFKNFQSVLVGIDVAWSEERWRFFFRTSASF